MKFGRIDTELLDLAHLQLPPEPETNTLVLEGSAVTKPEIYLGCTQWKCDAWLGKIYPERIRDSEILDAYLRQFNCIEMNAMHYRIFPPATVAKWASRAAGSAFKFCPKFPQSISHYSRFSNARLQTDQFLESITALGSHLGPSFLQVSDGYVPDGRQALWDYLVGLPRDLRFFVELRHEAWFKPEQASQTAHWLREHGIGWVITDAPGRRDVCHMHLTTPVAFIRFLGNNLHPTDYPRIDAWVARIKDWASRGLKEVYFFMHHPEEDGAPELIDYMIQRIQEQMGIFLKRPVFLPTQTSLF